MGTLTPGSGWDYVGKRIQGGSIEEQYALRYEVLKHARVSTSTGQTDAIQVIRRDASGGTVEWWAKGIGLIKREELSSSHRSLAEMVHYTIPGQPIRTASVPESRIEDESRPVDEATHKAQEELNSRRARQAIEMERQKEEAERRGEEKRRAQERPEGKRLFLAFWKERKVSIRTV